MAEHKARLGCACVLGWTLQSSANSQCDGPYWPSVALIRPDHTNAHIATGFAHLTDSVHKFRSCPMHKDQILQAKFLLQVDTFHCHSVVVAAAATVPAIGQMNWFVEQTGSLLHDDQVCHS